MIDSIRLCGLNYTVDVISELYNPQGKLDGRVQHELNRISIETNMSKQASLLTLLHEIGHIIACQIGKPNVDESLLDALAYQTFQLLVDNPKFTQMFADPELGP